MDYKEKYNQTLFLETIKTGKTPKRSGLGTRLMLLAGVTNPVLSTLKKNIKKPLKGNELEYVFGETTKLNRIEFYKNTFVYGGTYRIQNDIIGDAAKAVFYKYLGRHLIKSNGAYVFVFFSNDIEINWGDLDEALKLKYPKSHRIDKRGFVYFDYKKK